uniref:Uncharacterized protein n=1 Tax=viral metagenome TaxID=1070528 RepID=A0A6C0EJB6_9ZZZZ
MKLYNSIFYSILLIISIVFILHYREFYKVNNTYEILNINNKLTNYNKYIREKLPIIFTKNIDIDDIISPITIKKYTIKNLDYNNYLCHTNDLLFIVVNDAIIINISTPIESSKFKQVSSKGTEKGKEGAITSLKNINNTYDYKYIQLKLNKNNILSIPRYWVFKILTLNPNIDIYSYDTLFTRIFNLV